MPEPSCLTSSSISMVPQFVCMCTYIYIYIYIYGTSFCVSLKSHEWWTNLHSICRKLCKLCKSSGIQNSRLWEKLFKSSSAPDKGDADKKQLKNRKKNWKTTIPHRTMPGSRHGCLDLGFFGKIKKQNFWLQAYFLGGVFGCLFHLG